MTLTEFVTARLDEEEAAMLAFIGREDLEKPAKRAGPRMLREVTAKRAIVASYSHAWERYQDELEVDGSSKYDDGALAEWREKWYALEPVGRFLAAIWSDHPDYDPTWA